MQIADVFDWMVNKIKGFSWNSISLQFLSSLLYDFVVIELPVFTSSSLQLKCFLIEVVNVKWMRNSAAIKRIKAERVNQKIILFKLFNLWHRKNLINFTELRTLFSRANLIFNVFKRFRSIGFLGIIIWFRSVSCNWLDQNLFVLRRVPRHDDSTDGYIFNRLIMWAFGNTDNF